MEITAPPGGVMTREAGAITGDLELWLDPTQAGAAHVRYVGAADAYTVTGRASGMNLDQVAEALQHDQDGNPQAAQLLS